MVQTHDLKQCTFDDVDPLGLVLNEITWAIRSTHHTTTKESLVQLVFGQDILCAIPYIPDWDKLAKQKEQEMNKNNFVKNKNRLKYNYVISDKIMIYQYGYFRKLEGPSLGPYEIIQIYTHATVRI